MRRLHISILMLVVVATVFLFAVHIFSAPLSLDKITGTVYASGVVHAQKVYTNPITPAERCWKYESWYDLGTGNFRIDSYIPGSGAYLCRHSIDIVNGKDGSILALFPDKAEMRAKWRHKECADLGLGRGVVSGDPFSLFKQQFSDEHQTAELIEKTTRNGKDVYIVRIVKDGITSFVYYGVQDFFPYAMQSYSYASDRLWLDMKYPVGEIVEKSSLPEDFFKQIVPLGFILEDNTCEIGGHD